MISIQFVLKIFMYSFNAIKYFRNHSIFSTSKRECNSLSKCSYRDSENVEKCHNACQLPAHKSKYGRKIVEAVVHSTSHSYVQFSIRVFYAALSVYQAADLLHFYHRIITFWMRGFNSNERVKTGQPKQCLLGMKAMKNRKSEIKEEKKNENCLF